MRTKLLPLILLTFGLGCSDSNSTVETDIFGPASFGEYTFEGEPNIDAPEFVLFGDLEEGERSVQSIRVRNVGTDHLKFGDWTVSDGFDLTFVNLMTEQPVELRREQYLDIEIGHTSISEEEIRGTLTIESNDPDTPVLEIGLFVNARLPCLETDPVDTLDFGSIEKGTEVSRTIRFRNCSPNAETQFQLDPIEGDDAFAYANNRFSLQRHTLSPNEEVELDIVFSPEEIRNFSGSIDVQSDDFLNPNREIDLVGVGAPGRCPDASIHVSHPERGEATAEPDAHYFAVPLDNISLSGMASRGYDGRFIQRMEWRLIRRPQDSTAALSFSENDAQNALFLDLAGDYVIELDVWDSDGIKSCQPARLEVEAVADEDIHIQLVWDTPSDQNQTDNSGSDVDLHFKHDRGTWDASPFDCYWQNQNPDWASQRSSVCRTPESPGCHDDPSLDIDDTDGSGPENINLDNPEAANYAVGVHYYSDHGYGRSFVTIRIFIEGDLHAEFIRQPLDELQFWYVADIEWPAQVVLANGSITDTFPQ